MRAILQRVLKSSVEVEGEIVGQINKGFNILLGITHEDTEKEINWLVNKIVNLRIFSDVDGKMNLSLKDVGGEILLISQFTLYADSVKGRRPSFTSAANPKVAEKLYFKMIEEFRKEEIKIETGIFGEDMKVEIINDGPVTIILDTKDANIK